MNVLLDTATFIMMIAEPSRLSKKAEQIVREERNKVYLSVVSGWEIVIKNKLGKLQLINPASEILTKDVENHSIEIIHLDMTDILALTDLPVGRHKDPFDRMLVCQAKARRIPILSPDPVLKRYDVEVVW